MLKGTMPFPWYLKGPGIRQFDSADIDAWVQTCKVPAGKLPGDE
jgi:predicted DNA-binding transcriptional regulator AlpA